MTWAQSWNTDNLLSVQHTVCEIWSYHSLDIFSALCHVAQRWLTALGTTAIGLSSLYLFWYIICLLLSTFCLERRYNSNSWYTVHVQWRFIENIPGIEQLMSTDLSWVVLLLMQFTTVLINADQNGPITWKYEIIADIALWMFTIQGSFLWAWGFHVICSTSKGSF